MRILAVASDERAALRSHEAGGAPTCGGSCLLIRKQPVSLFVDRIHLALDAPAEPERVFRAEKHLRMGASALGRYEGFGEPAGA